MYPVNACPKNLAEIDKASTRLGCGTDQYGNNQYLCLPNKEKTTLVEFCYQGLMGLQEKGNCLEVSNGQLSNYNCTSFLHGCPDVPVKNHEFYKHAACQAINFKYHCYRLDPACPPDIACKDCDDNVVGIILACVLSVIITFIAIAFVYKIMKKRKLEREKRNDIESCDGRLVENHDTDKPDAVYTEKESTANMRNNIQTLHMDQTFSGNVFLHRSSACSEDDEETARLVDNASIQNLGHGHEEEHCLSHSSNIQNGIACKRTRHDTDTSIESYVQEEIDVGESQTSEKKLRG